MTSLAAIRRLPLFMAYCPDAPSALARRLEVRPEHLKRWAQDKEAGRGFFGLGLKPSPSTPGPNIELPPGIQPMAGSMMIFHADTLDNAWDRIKSDVYYTAGVWDKGRVVVEEFITPPEGYMYPKEYLSMLSVKIQGPWRGQRVIRGAVQRSTTNKTVISL